MPVTSLAEGRPRSQEQTMNTLSSASVAALEMAHQTIADRVHDAESRTQARAARRQRRSSPPTGPFGGPSHSNPKTWWTTWVTHPAH